MRRMGSFHCIGPQCVFTLVVLKTLLLQGKKIIVFARETGIKNFDSEK